MTPTAPPNTPRRRQLLALSGGGYRGLFSAIVLEELETFAGSPLANHFDLLSGTSIGGLLATVIAVGLPVSKARQALESQAPLIFPRRRLRLLRQLFGTLYDSNRLRQAIEQTLGPYAQLRLCELDKPLLLPAVSWVTGRTVLLASRGLAGSSASELTLLDATMATSAAPTYFRPHPVDGDVLLDGGLACNAPDQAALARAQWRWATSIDSIYMLSVGTAGTSVAGMAGDVPTSGWRWMNNRLLPLLLEAQENLAVLQSEQLLGERYLRLNPVPASGQGALSAMDIVDASMTDTLRALAQATVRQAKAQQLALLSGLCGHQV